MRAILTVPHRLLSFLLATAWVAFTHLVAVCLAFGNFVVAWQAFEAQGYEQVPLAEVPFLGPFAVAVGLGSAPIAALYALVLVAAVNVIVITAAKQLTILGEVFLEWRQVRRSPDPEIRARSPEYPAKLGELAAWLVPLLVLAVFVIRWDVAQFSFRQTALVMDLVDPGEALDWPLDAVARVGAYLAKHFATSALGYMACIVGAALVMEHAHVRARDRWRALVNAIEEAVQPSGGQPDAPVDAHPASIVPSTAVVATPAGASSGETTPAGRERPATGGAIEPVAAPLDAAMPATPPPAAPAQEVDVVIGPGLMQRVAVAEVERNPDCYVRDRSGRQWFLRHYYDEMMATEPTSKEAAG